MSLLSMPSAQEVRELCAKFGYTAQRPLNEAELMAAERGKKTRKTHPKRNRYLPQG